MTYDYKALVERVEMLVNSERERERELGVYPRYAVSLNAIEHLCHTIHELEAEIEKLKKHKLMPNKKRLEER